MTALVWFRHDLRVADNSALNAAATSGEPVLAVYVLNEERLWPLGGATRVWLHESLQRLRESLLNLGITLLFRKGVPAKVLERLVVEYDVTELHWNRDYDPDGIAESTAVKKCLSGRLLTRSHAGSLLIEPTNFRNKSGEPYRVFTPFWNGLRKSIDGIDTPSIPTDWQQQNPIVTQTSADELDLLSRKSWEAGLASHWRFGERAAWDVFEDFVLADVEDYASRRDFPAFSKTSKLSAYLHFGEISVRRIWIEMTQRLNSFNTLTDDASAWSWLRQLAWREFSQHLLFHFPVSATQALNSRFDDMTWLDNGNLLALWQRGDTGYPLVDAGMRELWETGWMHNRVRMVVASFLTKHLGIHWLKGAHWFWDTLVDADLANNTMGWQWVAGCGADAAPYYRIFNPTLQSQKFDPQGKYIRLWVPELEKLDNVEIHEPAKAVEAGRVDYPPACVDHREAREAALERYQQIRD